MPQTAKATHQRQPGQLAAREAVAAESPRLRWAAVLLVIGCIAAGVVAVQRHHSNEVTSLRSEIEALKGAQTNLRKEVEALRGQVRAGASPAPASAPAATPPPRPDVVLSIEGAAFKGDPNAPVTLIEFTDYQCDFCARHVRETIPQLERDYIATGKLKYVFRNFPLEATHKQAFKAHEAASCAGEQGKFWEMHDRLFANYRALGPADIVAHATAVGVDTGRLQACMNVGLHAAEIRNDIARGRAAGVTATPAFFFGPTQPNSSNVKIASTLKGAKPYAKFKEMIDALLAAQPSS